MRGLEVRLMALPCFRYVCEVSVPNSILSNLIRLRLSLLRCSTHLCFQPSLLAYPGDQPMAAFLLLLLDAAIPSVQPVVLSQGRVFSTHQSHEAISPQT